MNIYIVFKGRQYEGERVDSAFLQQDDAERRVAELENNARDPDLYYYFQEQEVL